MSTYSKIVLTTLPIVFLLMATMTGTTYYFTHTALTELTKTWLDTRLSEAMKIAAGQNEMLQRYGLEKIPAGIQKAKMDACTTMSAIKVGALGSIFAVDHLGHIVFCPKSSMTSKDVSQEPWFRELKPERGWLVHPTLHGKNLAVVDYFKPWKWYILASDPKKEIYGFADQMKLWILVIGGSGFGIIAVALMLVVRQFTDPLQLLTEKAEKIGKGDLDTRISIHLKSELGSLAHMFNKMAGRLQKSHRQLEARVAERTAELFAANKQLQKEIEERKQMAKEMERLQGQMLQTKKMEAIGTLAGGMAHDFNNLFMGIQGNVDILAFDIGTDPDHHKRIETIRKCITSGSRLTQQLLGFARLGKYEVEEVDPNLLVRETIAIFGEEKPEETTVTRFQPDVWKLNIDREQIGQALNGILLNAAQAMPEGGIIRIETTNETLDEQKASLYRVSPGRYVRISISDTGVGMDKSVMDQIFDPFFTTKTMQRGTGLGLASAYGVVKNHGGHIDVESEINIGTTFHIFLKAHVKTEAVEKTKSFHRGDGTILLVDDDPMILDVGKVMLSALGYEVLTAEGGKKAVSIYRQNLEKISLVILDMMMPDMGGGKTFDRLKELNPGILVLLASGYSLEGKAADIMDRGCSGFIQKPFNMQLLSEKVITILERAI